MTTQLSTIQFNNQSLVTFEQNGTYYTAMKPICENIGLDWAAQYQRFKRDEVLKSVIVMITTTGTDGKSYQMICLPIQYLNGWLFGIDTNRVKPEIRETLIKYKKECYQALFDYWFKGKAERIQTTVDDRTGLRDAVNMLVSKKCLIYSDAYNLVHQYMNVKSIEDISKDDLPKAVEYVHRIILDGELIIPQEAKQCNLTEEELKKLAWLWKIAERMRNQLYTLHEPLKLLKSQYAESVYGTSREYQFNIEACRKILERETRHIEFDVLNRNNWNDVLVELRDGKLKLGF